MLFADSLVTVITGLGSWFVDGKHLKKAVFRAENVRESLLLISCLAFHHALLAVGAAHLS